MMLQRGLRVDHTTIYRSRPTVCSRTGSTLPPPCEDDNGLAGWVDETYIKVKKEWVYLYRAVDAQGNTLDFWLSETRDTEAAKQFFQRVLTAAHSVTPRVINVDKNAAYPKALKELKAEGTVPESCELRQVKYLNNLVEQDHRFIKRLTKPGMGFFSFQTAWRTVQGFEVMNMIRKGQVRGGDNGDILGQVTFIANLFEVVA